MKKKLISILIILTIIGNNVNAQTTFNLGQTLEDLALNSGSASNNSYWNTQNSILQLNQYYSNNNNGNPNTGGCDNAGGMVDQCANCVAVGGTECTPTPPTECGGPGSTWTQECGCIGGNTGIAECPPPCNNTELNMSDVTISGGYTAIPPLESSVWGRTWPGRVDVTFSMCVENGVWLPILTSVTGVYGQVVRLLSGCQEVEGPGRNTNSSNFCAQVAGLLAWGEIPPGQTTSPSKDWFMISAVQAHENYHLSFFEDLLEFYGLPVFEPLFEGLFIPYTGQTESQAIAQLLQTSQYTSQINNIYNIWWNRCNERGDIDHNNGSTRTQVQNVVIPKKNTICTHAASNSWPTCTLCN